MSMPALAAAVAAEDKAIDEVVAEIDAVRKIPLAVMNQSSVITDTEIQAMIPAFSTQWNRDLVPVWGVDPVIMSFVPKGATPLSSAWWLVFLDDSDQAGALAYHDLTNTGLPISKIFVKTLQADHASISVGASHELCEMSLDPFLNSAAQDASNVFWALENCDPCEDDSYGYEINGVLVTDFVTPSWFGHQYAAAPFDFAGHCQSAFEVLSGGYAQKFSEAGGWTQITGSKARSFERARAVVGSRRERRMRSWKSWERSGVKFGT
jgi:hypothetical protein